MARAGITYYDVSKAAESLRDRGRKVSVDSVREHMGTGSKSTITPLLRDWRANQKDTDIGSELPEEILESITSVYRRIRHLADEQVQGMRDEFVERSEQLLAQAKKQDALIADLKETKAEQAKSLEAAQTEIESLKEIVQEHNHTIGKLQVQKDEALSRADEYKETIADLRRENGEVRKHFEHYQQRVAEEHQGERDHWVRERARMEDRLAGLEATVAKAHEEISEATRSYTECQAICEGLNRENSDLLGDIDRATSETQTLKKSLKEALDDNAESLNLVASLKTKVSEISQSMAEVERDHALSVKDSEQANEKANDLRIANERLAEENKSLIRNLAVAQEKLKKF